MCSHCTTAESWNLETPLHSSVTKDPISSRLAELLQRDTAGQFHLLLPRPTQHNRVCPLESICGRDVNKHFCPNAVLISTLYLGISLRSLSICSWVSSSRAVQMGTDQWPGVWLWQKWLYIWNTAQPTIDKRCFQITSLSIGNQRRGGKTTVEEEQEKQAILISWMWVKRLSCMRHKWMLSKKWKAPLCENNGTEGFSLWSTHRLAYAKRVVHRGSWHLERSLSHWWNYHYNISLVHLYVIESLKICFLFRFTSSIFRAWSQSTKKERKRCWCFKANHFTCFAFR